MPRQPIGYDSVQNPGQPCRLVEVMAWRAVMEPRSRVNLSLLAPGNLRLIKHSIDCRTNSEQ